MELLGTPQKIFQKSNSLFLVSGPKPLNTLF